MGRGVGGDTISVWELRTEDPSPMIVQRSQGFSTLRWTPSDETILRAIIGARRGGYPKFTTRT
eukprot:10578842-Prorocentrum_lima.AAC.1